MGYRVVYGCGGRKKEAGQGRAALLTAAFFLAFVLLVNGLWPRGAQTLRKMLLPGDPAVTAAAWEELTRELQTGAPVGSAVESFCRDILRNADVCPG